MTTPIIYIGAFLQLDQEKRNHLLSLFSQKLKKEYLHHITLSFRPKKHEISMINFGQEIEVEVTGIAEDQQAQVLECSLPKNVYCNNERPHITVATNGETPPKYSNQLLKLNTLPLSEPISIKAKIGYWNGKDILYRRP